MTPKQRVQWSVVVVLVAFMALVGSKGYYDYRTKDVTGSTSPPAKKLPSKKSPVVTKPVAVGDRDVLRARLLAQIAKLPQEEQDQLCLALNGYYEARNEPTEGERMVMYITDERLKEKRLVWGKTMCDVVFKQSRKLQRKVGHKPVLVIRHQFSWVGDKEILRYLLGHNLVPGDPTAWSRSQRLASEHRAGKYTPPATLRLARYYYNPKGSDATGSAFFGKLEYLDKVGRHKFYKDKKVALKRPAVLTKR